MKKIMLSFVIVGVCGMSLQAIPMKDWIFFKGKNGALACSLPMSVPRDASPSKKAIACCESFWEIEDLDGEAYGWKNAYMQVCVPRATQRLNY